MKKNRDSLPLSGRVFGKLSLEEESALLRASIDDQDLFNQLANDEEERVLLRDPAVRRQMIDATHGAGTSLAAQLRAWWTLGRGLSIASFAVAVIVLMVVVQRSAFESRGLPHGPTVTTSSTGGVGSRAAVLSPDLGARLFQYRRSQQADGVELVLSSSNLRIGDRFRLRFRVSEPLRVIVVERRSDGSVTQLYPWMTDSAASVRANQDVFIPPSGQGEMRLAGPPGKRTVRLLAFSDSGEPVESLLRSGSAESPAYVVDREYELLGAPEGRP